MKFTLTANGTLVSSGVHALSATFYTSALNSDPAIDATPREAATAGSQFRFAADSGEWHFNLDTKSMAKGVWKLTATLSDGTEHNAWIQLK